ncbi:MAG: acetyl-CoA decarbonylase/synthase complex subunit delta [Gemmatimonadetes bacterium]|jgi:acetyl-CoA decarbonylase/synthase, CODH/ACS complex subunit delta|nr:acetyl-CoA decarbonylase/synthase complex subunit delta [Gemmatimonadota bacterium]
MAFEIPKVSYSGKIKEIQLGEGPKAITVGGEASYPFHLFEGEMPHAPRIAMEVYDVAPEDWPPAAMEPFAGVMDDPVAWAKKCIDEYGAEMICLQLVSIDPNGLDRSVAEATEVVQKVAEAVDVPLIVWGCGNDEKDAEVLRQVAEVCEGKSLSIGPVTEDNYKQVGAAAIAYKHTVIASTPIDINLCKQLNILLADLGVPDEKIVVDPTTGGLGYGLEYTYSVMERSRMAALTQQDERLQFPMICNLAKEVWKVKEVKTPEAEDPKLGDGKKRGVAMEATTAMSLLLAGASVLVMRHPEAIAQVRTALQDLSSN